MPLAHELPFTMSDIKEVILEAAAITYPLYKAGVDVVDKIDGSPLTEADIKVNDFLKKNLLKLLPDSGWLSEETTDCSDRLTKEWTWVVDPLDGTREFVLGIPEFAISVGLVSGQQVVMGVVINPASGEGGIGVVGGQVEFWGGLQKKPAPDSLSKACAIVSRTEMEDESVLPLLDLVGSYYPLGSVAYKLLRVSYGSDHLTISAQHKSEWDICGGVGLLLAVGKVYCRFDGEAVRFNQALTRIRSGAVAGDLEIANRFLAELTSLR